MEHPFKPPRKPGDRVAEVIKRRDKWLKQKKPERRESHFYDMLDQLIGLNDEEHRRLLDRLPDIPGQSVDIANQRRPR